MRSYEALLAILLVAACGDDSGGGGPIDSGQHIDAPADVSPDADPSIAPLVGTWVKGADSWSGQMIPMATFRANGTMSLGDTATAQEGTSTVPSLAAEGTGLVFTATTPSALTYHFRPIGMAGIGMQLFTKQ